MFWTSIRSSPPDLSRTLQKLLPKKLPPSLTTPKGNLFEVLSKTASGGVGKHVYQTRWSRKQISDSYWVVTRTKLKCEGKHGKAWGKLVWRGKEVSEREELIRGSLKYNWAEGHSKADASASQAQAQ
ncbi:hypothetical protein Moror_1416 [Moniliophthora roreri MCA 2997]|uniref:Uncharacterized protein n=1 Tax=Moniliophthora roreri (strain MCA 2997) TaxID=1381753 RepID=V2X3M3_MONRO|nr:hypothetical protein Moror_1416 [Moniliophthora roreri MCA 2997]KAI3596679.1 hypothetical protein WG66_016394 [Moniliophthora roreri]